MTPRNARVDHAFQSQAWQGLELAVIQLRVAHRQVTDPEFTAVLREVRLGQPSFEAYMALRARDGLAAAPQAVHLRARNQDVDTENERRFADLTGPARVFHCTDSGREPERVANCVAPAVLTLRPGARVVLLANVDATLVNGSCGRVEHFHPDSGLPVVRFDNGRTEAVAEFEWQVRCPDAGARDGPPPDLDLRIMEREPDELDEREQRMRQRVEAWYREGVERSIVARRRQIPLRLAWALTIHRAQGMTLDAVDIDAGRIFEAGQLYVALSRARTLEGVSLHNLRRTLIRADPVAVRFYRELDAAH